MALLIDRLTGEQELVIKPLGWPLRRVRNVGGAAVLGSGETVPILNPADLLQGGLRLARVGVGVPVGSSGAHDNHAEASPARRRRVLVVDDSPTTRMLERGILEAAGYDTVVAGDGAEALGLLSRETVDLVVSDVEMPNLDGFGLTAAIRRDERLRHLPVVLVTSLDDPEHRERGVTVGADAYLGKRTFDQGQLLDTIGRLL
ncbi:MAG: response regulator [Thermomicrobiales bacterium]